VQEFQVLLPGLTHGEGVWTSYPSGDRPVREGEAARAEGGPIGGRDGSG